MPKRSKAELDILIRVTIAAGLFAIHTELWERDAKEIANLLNTSERSVHRWAKNAKNGKKSCKPSTTRASGTSESNPHGVDRNKKRTAANTALDSTNPH